MCFPSGVHTTFDGNDSGDGGACGSPSVDAPISSKALPRTKRHTNAFRNCSFIVPSSYSLR